MAILALGTSIADFPRTGSPVVQTSSSAIDTYVAEGIFCGLGTNGPNIPLSNVSELWLAFYLNWSGASGGADPGIGFFNGTTELFRLNGVGNTSTEALSYHNGTSLQTDVVSGGSMAGLHRYDVHLKMADTGGIFVVYKDGVIDLDLSSVTTDTLRTAATGITNILMRAVSLSSSSYSGIIVADEDTRALRLHQQLPSGAGANTAWSGAYTAVDEVGIDDTDAISSGTLTDKSTFAFPAAHTDFNTSAWAVRAVAVSIRGVATPDGSIDIGGVVRTGGADYASAGLDTPPAYGAVHYVWDQNPGTTADWTYSEASGSQVGVKVTS